MPRPRKELVSLIDTPYYHITSRCVRRAFLCGHDHYSGQNFDHRKPWLIKRLDHLVSTFSIHLCAYAIMDNHYHLVLKIDPDSLCDLSNQQIVERWKLLFSLPALVDQWHQGQLTAAASIQKVIKIIDLYRERLSDISWFMRCLNEYIARKANQEENCTGRFWEGRYHSQALLDEQALLTCMAYVDLNPIRAGITHTPESSDFTSVQARITQSLGHSTDKSMISTLMGCDHHPMDNHDLKVNRLPFTLPDYLDIVDWAGRIVREGKKGFIPDDLPPILERMNLHPQGFIKQLDQLNTSHRRAYGSLQRLQQYCHSIKQRWIWGMGNAFHSTSNIVSIQTPAHLPPDTG